MVSLFSSVLYSELCFHSHFFLQVTSSFASHLWLSQIFPGDARSFAHCSEVLRLEGGGIRAVFAQLWERQESKQQSRTYTPGSKRKEKLRELREAIAQPNSIKTAQRKYKLSLESVVSQIIIKDWQFSLQEKYIVLGNLNSTSRIWLESDSCTAAQRQGGNPLHCSLSPQSAITRILLLRDWIRLRKWKQRFRIPRSNPLQLLGGWQKRQS